MIYPIKVNFHCQIIQLVFGAASNDTLYQEHCLTHHSNIWSLYVHSYRLLPECLYLTLSQCTLYTLMEHLFWPLGAGYHCKCTPETTGIHCEGANPCASNPCTVSSTCLADGNDYKCKCNKGYDSMDIICNSYRWQSNLWCLHDRASETGNLSHSKCSIGWIQIAESYNRLTCYLFNNYAEDYVLEVLYVCYKSFLE